MKWQLLKSSELKLQLLTKFMMKKNYTFDIKQTSHLSR